MLRRRQKRSWRDYWGIPIIALALLFAAYLIAVRYLPSFSYWQVRYLPLRVTSEINPLLFWTPILILVCVWSLLRIPWRRSELLEPAALLLETDLPSHLKGRTEDLERLLRLCREHPLVFLIGESGSGKSALLQAGLLEELRTADSTLLPVYIDSWGSDWEKGPRSALAEKLNKVLTPELRAEIDHPGRFAEENLLTILGLLKVRAHRKALLIFDQYDDYQTRHLDRFFVDCSPIAAQELCRQNVFWDEMRSLVESDQVRCLFVSRHEVDVGLESVRFITPQIYHLTRVQNGYMASLLRELTEPGPGQPAVIKHPAHGWEQLRGRLLQDLGQDGRVLPIQLKVALLGLAQLPFLTVSEYLRAGGLAGLEALYIESQLVAASEHSGLPVDAVLWVVGRLVSPQKPDTTAADLLAEVPAELAHVLTAAKVTTVLDTLAKRKVVRERPHSGQETKWEIDHAYLIRGVRLAEQHAAPSSTAAKEQYEEFLKARSLSKVWVSLRALVSSAALRAAFSRRLRDPELRRFVAAVLVAQCLIIALLVSGAVISVRRGLEQLRMADWLNEVDMDMSGGPSVDLIRLSRSDQVVRNKYLMQLLDRSYFAVRSPERSRILRALVGLNPARRDAAYRDVLRPCLSSLNLRIRATLHETPARSEICSSWIYELNPPSQLISEDPLTALKALLPLAVSGACVAERVSNRDKKADRFDLMMARELRELCSRIPRSQAGRAAQLLVEGVELKSLLYSRCPVEPIWLAEMQGLEILADELTPDEALDVYRQLSTHIDYWRANDRTAVEKQGRATAEKLVRRISPQGRQELWSALLLDSSGVFNAELEALLPLLRALPRELSRAEGQQLFLQVLETGWRHEQSQRELHDLILASWKEKELQALLDETLQRIEDSQQPDKRALFGSTAALSALLGRLPGASRLTAAQRLLLLFEKQKQRKLNGAEQERLVSALAKTVATLEEKEQLAFLSSWWQLLKSELGQTCAAQSAAENGSIAQLEHAVLSSFTDAARFHPPEAELRAAWDCLSRLASGPAHTWALARQDFLGFLIPKEKQAPFIDKLLKSDWSLKTLDARSGFYQTICAQADRYYPELAAISPKVANQILTKDCVKLLSEAAAQRILEGIYQSKNIVGMTSDESMLLLHQKSGDIERFGPVQLLELTDWISSAASTSAPNTDAPGFYTETWKYVLKSAKPALVTQLIQARLAEVSAVKTDASSGTASAESKRQQILSLGRVLTAWDGELPAELRPAYVQAVQSVADSSQRAQPESLTHVLIPYLKALTEKDLHRLLIEAYRNALHGDSYAKHFVIVDIFANTPQLPRTRVWMQRYVDLVNGIEVSDELRLEVMRCVEKLAGQKFDGNVWKFAEWAGSQGYDISVPKWGR